MEPPPSAHALLPLAPGTGLRSKLAGPGHGAGAPEVSRLPTFLCSLSPFPNFFSACKKSFISFKKQNVQILKEKKKKTNNKTKNSKTF